MPLRWLTRTVAAAGVLALCYAPTAAEQKQEPSAAEVWERAIAAKGGREVLHNVTSLLRSETLPRGVGLFKHVTNRFETLAVFPSRYWMWADQRPFVWGLTLDVVDLDRSLHRTLRLQPLLGPTLRDADGNDRCELRDLQALLLMESRWQRPAIIGLRKDDRTWVLETRVADTRYEYHLAADTYLPFQVVTMTDFEFRGFVGYYPPPTGPIVRSYRLREYRSVSGVQLPCRIESTRPGDVTYKYSVRYEINVAYDESIFTEPVLKDDPRSWEATRLPGDR